MKIYTDINLTEEITDVLSLGTVQAGESKTFTFYVVNNSMALLQNLEFSIDHQEIKIVNFPESLSAQARDKFTVEWNPTVTLKEGLHAPLRIKCEELWG